MSRANDDTQVDYSLLDDAALGNAVAGKVLSASYIRDGDYWELPGESFSSDDLVSWWGAGLVIDTLRAEGRAMLFDIEPSPALSHVHTSTSVGRDESPVRAILIAALRAKEAE